MAIYLYSVDAYLYNIYNLWQWLRNKVQLSYYQEYKEKHCHLQSIIREHWKLATQLPKPKMRRTKKTEIQDQQDHNKFQVLLQHLPIHLNNMPLHGH